MKNPDAYLDGTRLYGDDFSAPQIAEWYADEEEGYANLGARDTGNYQYGYHAWNIYHAYRYLRGREFQHALGFGSAYGDELLPIISQIRRLTIVDSSDAFVRDRVHGIPVTYVKPSPDGRLPMADGSFDLITCLGVLHHIPNVSFVVSELARTLRPGGQLVMREPIVSMGDWRRVRPGLTARERGIPLAILQRIVHDSGLLIERQALCDFPLTRRVLSVFWTHVYNSSVASRVDAVISAAFAWNVNYHPRTAWQRLRPTSTFLILKKP